MKFQRLAPLLVTIVRRTIWVNNYYHFNFFRLGEKETLLWLARAHYLIPDFSCLLQHNDSIEASHLEGLAPSDSACVWRKIISRNPTLISFVHPFLLHCTLDSRTGATPTVCNQQFVSFKALLIIHPLQINLHRTKPSNRSMLYAKIWKPTSSSVAVKGEGYQLLANI